MKNIIIISLLAISYAGFTQTNSRVELGCNFNHIPEIIDFKYLEKSQVEWIRTTPYIFKFINGELDVNTDEGLNKVIKAGEMGYKVSFGFRWDFKRYNLNIPEPGSEKENEYFNVVRKILDRVGPHVDMFKLGNEPVFETLQEDMAKGSDGKIPLVVFTERLLTEVVDPYFKNHSEIPYPDIYAGSIPAIFSKRVQEIDATNGLLQFAQDNDMVTGMDIHIHISKIEEIEESFQYARRIIPEKPFIVTEFSLHRMYLAHVSDIIGDTPEGKVFAKKYNRDPNLKIHEWLTIANSKGGVTSQEWDDLFASRSWYPKHYLKTYFKYYHKYGVRLATYPLIQQHAPTTIPEDSNNCWFINPVFLQTSLLKDENGEYSPNPLCFDDFVELANEGKESQK